MHVVYLERPLKLGGHEWTPYDGTAACGAHKGKWDPSEGHKHIHSFVHAAVSVNGVVYEFQPKNGFRKSLLKGIDVEGRVEVGRSKVEDFPIVHFMGNTQLSHDDIKVFMRTVFAYNLYANNCQSFAQGLVRFLLPEVVKIRRDMTVKTSSRPVSPVDSWYTSDSRSPSPALLTQLVSTTSTEEEWSSSLPASGSWTSSAESTDSRPTTPTSSNGPMIRRIPNVGSPLGSTCSCCGTARTHTPTVINAVTVFAC